MTAHWLSATAGWATAAARRSMATLRHLAASIVHKLQELRTVTLVVLSVAILFLILFAVSVCTLPTPETIVVLSGRTEKLTMRALNPSEAAIDIGGMKLMSLDFGGSTDRSCIAGTVLPSSGALVTYRRAGQDGPIIEISHPRSAGLLASSTGGRDLPPSISLTADPGCAGALPTRLPVWGAIDVGDNLRAIGRDGVDNRSFVLLSGNLNVYARSVSHFWWFSLPRSLYFIRSVELPVGTRITTGPLDSSRSEPAWGLLSIDREDGFKLSLSTQTSNLTVFVPGSSVDPDSIDVTGFVQVFEDPNLVAIQIYLAVILGVLGFASSMIQIFSSLKDGERRGSAPP
jgi:hypothetical protein